MVCPVGDDDSSLSSSSFLQKQQQSVTNQNELHGNPTIHGEAKGKRQNPCHTDLLNSHSKFHCLLAAIKPPKPITAADKANVIS